VLEKELADMHPKFVHLQKMIDEREALLLAHEDATREKEKATLQSAKRMEIDGKEYLWLKDTNELIPMPKFREGGFNPYGNGQWDTTTRLKTPNYKPTSLKKLQRREQYDHFKCLERYGEIERIFNEPGKFCPKPFLEGSFNPYGNGQTNFKYTQIISNRPCLLCAQPAHVVKYVQGDDERVTSLCGPCAGRTQTEGYRCMAKWQQFARDDYVPEYPPLQRGQQFLEGGFNPYGNGQYGNGQTAEKGAC